MTMENSKIVLISLSEAELQNLVTNAVKQALEVKQQKELLSFKEVCQFLNVSASCLNQWKSQGRIPWKKLGKRVYFNRSELISALEEGGNYKKLKELE